MEMMRELSTRKVERERVLCGWVCVGVGVCVGGCVCVCMYVCMCVCAHKSHFNARFMLPQILVRL